MATAPSFSPSLSPLVGPTLIPAPHTSSTGGPRKNCTYYYVHLDADNHPIPGTMFGRNSQRNPMACVTKIARLTGSEMFPAPGEIQCFPSNGLRYWYQVKSTPGGGGGAISSIVPNSMIAVKGVPKGPAGRSCQYVEYKIFKSV